MLQPLKTARPVAPTALAVLLAACLLGGLGCSTISDYKGSPGGSARRGQSPYLANLERRQWWDSVRSEAEYVNGRGYYLAETGRYYDGEGNELSSINPLVDGVSFEEPEAKPDSVLGMVTPSTLVETTRELVTKDPNQVAAQQLYEQGEAAYRAALELEGDDRQDALLDVADTFGSSASLWNEAPLQEDALFLRAESLFFADRYYAATTAYAELIKQYPSTRYLDTVDARRFTVAQYWIALDDEENYWLVTPNFIDHRRPRFDTRGFAIKLLDRIRIDDPTGDLADDATMAAGNAEFFEGNYEEAHRYYSDLRESYPTSSHQFQAHVLGVKTALLLYQGPEYSSVPLDTAEELVRSTMRLFPEEAAPEQEYLERALADVRLKQAEREWQLARFYDNRAEYRSARIYYERVRTEFSDTSLASRAEERLASISTKPDEPAVRAAWLVDWFIEEQDPAVAIEETRLAEQPDENQPYDPR